jgi:opacity protein-like surface antigen
MSWINTKGSTPDLVPFNINSVSATQQDWLDTLRGRLGVARGRTLIYATGGGAFTGADVTVCPLAGCVSQSKTVSGWTVGGGVEYAFLNGWSAKLEYGRPSSNTSMRTSARRSSSTHRLRWVREPSLPETFVSTTTSCAPV